MAEEFDEGIIDAEYVDPAKIEVPFWRPVYEFAVHGIVGTTIFLIVAAFAVLLDLLVQWLEARHAVSWEILLGLKWTSLVIFAADIFLTLVFVLKMAYRTARKL